MADVAAKGTLADKLRRGMEARARSAEVAGPRAPDPQAPQAAPEAADVVKVPPAAAGKRPALPEGAGLAELAGEAEAVLREALEHHGIQRDSIRLVLACHALMLPVLPAHAKELERIMEAGRRPMAPEEVAAWKAELMGAVVGSLARLEALHADVGQRAHDGAAEGVAKAARQVVEVGRRANVIRQARAYAIFFCAGAALAASVVLSSMTWRVSVAGAGLTLTLGEAQAWVDVIAENRDPRRVLPTSALRTDPKTGDVYWQGVDVVKSRGSPRGR